ncbi:MAG: glycoside hydrolase family 95 protein, partial [Planctomycetota bacterium]
MRGHGQTGLAAAAFLIALSACGKAPSPGPVTEVKDAAPPPPAVPVVEEPEPVEPTPLPVTGAAKAEETKPAPAAEKPDLDKPTGAKAAAKPDTGPKPDGKPGARVLKELWPIVKAPAHWEDQPGGPGDYDGIAWYRRFVEVPAGWKGEKLALSLGKIDDADETFVNGVLVGKTGVVGGGHQGAWSASRRYEVAPGHVRPGGANLIAVRVHDSGGKGGIWEGPLSISCAKGSLSLEGAWQLRKGDVATWAKWPFDPDGAEARELVAAFLKGVAVTPPPPVAGPGRRRRGGRPAPKAVPLEGDAPPPEGDLVLWYRRPAARWMEEALPIGNGRFGGMVFGGVEKERVQFNEDSLWTGDEKDTGHYQAFGDLFIDTGHARAADYRRQLDIGRALHQVSYTSGGVRFLREYFCSHPDQVMVLRLSADRRGSQTGKVSLADMHGAKVVAEGNRLTSSGALSNGLKYEAQVLVVNRGGTLEAGEGAIEFAGADSLIILLSAGTDYLADYSKGWRGEHPHGKVTGAVDAAAGRTYGELLARHVEDYQGLFNRVRLDNGEPDPARRALPTDARLGAYRAGGADPGLEKLFFQHGRYLLIAS